jgi:AraC family transcriptional regulator of adaptative response/methylated-DNA-[protein]-cysteine methyltransferase
MSNLLWSAVTTRDVNADGMFVYAVVSTRVYCRPSCPSRRPRRDRVEFFPTPAMAEAHGYRACRRCRPDRPDLGPPALERVRRACAAMARAPEGPWPAPRLARAGCASVAQLQRAFRRVLGLSPRDYLAACRRRRFLDELRQGRRVTEAVYAAGYGSSAQAYGTHKVPGMTPATYGRGGRGATIAWTSVDSPVGRILVAATSRGACFVEIGPDDATLVKALAKEFPEAAIAPGPAPGLSALAGAARAAVAGAPVVAGLPLDVRGTAFQWRVWRALAAIPAGETRTYADVAQAVGVPPAARAVGRACATNPVALLIPCHRVVPKTGGVGNYRWGAAVKEALLAIERGRPR